MQTHDKFHNTIIHIKYLLCHINAPTWLSSIVILIKFTKLCDSFHIMLFSSNISFPRARWGKDILCMIEIYFSQFPKPSLLGFCCFFVPLVFTVLGIELRALHSWASTLQFQLKAGCYHINSCSFGTSQQWPHQSTSTTFTSYIKKDTTLPEELEKEESHGSHLLSESKHMIFQDSNPGNFVTSGNIVFGKLCNFSTFLMYCQAEIFLPQ